MSIFHSFAYLDYGTGTVIVQAIVGAVAGVALFGRRLLTMIKQKLGLIKRDEDDDIVVEKPAADSASTPAARPAQSKKPAPKKTAKKAKHKK